MNKITEKEFNRLIVDLNNVVSSVGGESTLTGLTAVAAAFGALLDIYALSNANNEKGMCDSPLAFRKHFANMIAEGPTIRESFTEKTSN